MHPGDIVAGKYRVAKILGRSRGLLLEARHTEFDQQVVVRLLSPAQCDEKQLEQFRREAKTLSKIETEHAARIIDVGTHSDGSFFLVRQHLEGTDLATQLRSRGALTLEEAILYTLQACEAVQECHSHNILLRELQPSHLFLTQRRGGSAMVKIIDFGTAKLLKDPTGQVLNGEMTATVMFGMSSYSSPELVRKVGTIDGRTDVWSLGCIFYELLAAAPAFQGEMAELMLRITQRDPIPLSQLRPDVPAELDQVIGWALAKDPASRFSSVYAFAHALRPYASNEGQVLIDRIGRIAHAETDHAHGALAGISPTSPLARNSTLPQAANEGFDPSDLEKTAYIGDINMPSPGGSQPGMGLGGNRPSQPAIPLGLPGAEYGAAGTGGYPAQALTDGGKRKRKRKLAAVVAAVSVLGIGIAGAAIFGGSSEPTASVDGSGKTTSDPDEDTAPLDDDGDEEANSEDTKAKPEPKSQPEETQASSPVDKTASGERSPTTSQTPTGGRWKAADKTSSKTGKKQPAPEPTVAADPSPPPPKPAKAASGKKGTLVAVATGGSCAFAIDGRSRGSATSSVKVSVQVGSHTVSCSPPGGATRTQRVTVRADKPGVAMFKLGGS